MRTRFLSIDYFSAEPPPSSPAQTLTFLDLPVPHLPSTLPLASEQDLLCFDSLSAIGVSLRLDRLEIESALSKFLTDVVPQFVDVGGEFCGNGSVQKEAELNREEKEKLDCCSTVKPPATEDELPKISSENFINEKGAQGIAVFQFETPELADCLENSHLLEEEAVGIFTEVLEIENNEDALDLGFSVNYTLEAQEAVTKFGDTSIQYLIEPKAVLLEDDANVARLSGLPCAQFPLLEGEEISLEVITSTSMNYELAKLLDKVEPLYLSQNDEFSFDTKEILNLLEKDLFEFPSPLSLFKECLESDLVIGNTFLEKNFVSIVDRTNLQGNSPYCQGSSDGDYFLSISPVVFEDIQIFDTETALFCEVLSLQEVHEPEFCNEMLHEKAKFNSFEELVISRELAPADQMFKSLPVPALCDTVLGTSYAIVAEALSDLKPQPPLASDGIYLNWHLLEEDSCSSAMYSHYHNMLEELNRSLDFDLNTSNYGKIILDFILLDHAPERPESEEGSGPLDTLSDGVSMLREGLTQAASRMSTDTEYQKPASQTLVSEHDSERASSLFKSMSPFHDLQFFLNPSKDRAEEISVPAGKIPAEPNDTHAVKIPGEITCKVSTGSPGVGNALCEPPVVGPGYIEQGIVSFLDSAIIVNTQNSSEVMLISRRRTYQKILAMEKEGIQVIERDTTLPVDIIISAAVCLVWYTCGNIGRKASGFSEGSSVLPSYIENIAANILTNLSFAFRSCILIFEGESGFLTSVMESSDGLCAAAASLGIDLQLFCSFSPELTDEIILNSIAKEIRNIRGLYSKLPESETLAESFLTKFPSVNPLSARAILSSEGMLSDFFESSQECRISTVQKYQVPDESVSLFSALCQFGEREDSRSIMTDCSSSVSSGPDSHYHNKLDSGGKRCKYKQNPDKSDVPSDDLLHFQPSKLCRNYSSKLPGFTDLYDSSIFKDVEIPNKLKESNSYHGHFLGQKRGMNESITTYPSRVGNRFDSRIKKGVFSSDVTEHQNLVSDDDFLSWNSAAHRARMDTFDWTNIKNSDILHKETEGEAINLTDPSIANSLEFSFSFSLPDLENDAKGGTNHASRFSFDQHNYPTFPTVAESDSTSFIHSPGNHQRQSLQEETDCFLSMELVNDKMPTDDREKLFKGFIDRRSMENSQGIPVQVNRARYYGTPLRNAIHMPHLQKGSPWTIEFLNRIREKSKLWQKSLPSSASPCCSNTRIKSNSTKRRSPSILEFFKYQGGSTVRKMPEEKRQKRLTRSFGSFKNGKVSASLTPSWTPVDKRARRKLSFATNESESQTKLVWGDRAREIHNH